MKDLKVVIIIPLVEERDYFFEAIKARKNWTVPKALRGSNRYTYQDSDRNAVVRVRTIDKMGHLEAVLAMNTAASAYGPELVILIGLAGSMDPEVIGYGDVVVSNQVKIYTPNKVGTISQEEDDNPFYHFEKTPPKTKPRGKAISVDDRDKMLETSYLRYHRDYVECSFVDDALGSVENVLADRELQQLEPTAVPSKFRRYGSINRDRQVLYGWIFGSDYVVDSKNYRDYLNDKDSDTAKDIYAQADEKEKIRWKKGKLLAMDMESYGVLKAIETLRTTPAPDGGVGNLVGGIIVRGISDMAESKGRSDRESKNELRRIAVHNAAEIAAQIIERLDYSTIVKR